MMPRDLEFQVVGSNHRRHHRMLSSALDSALSRLALALPARELLQELGVICASRGQLLTLQICHSVDR